MSDYNNDQYDEQNEDFAENHGELSDDELEDVAGGWGEWNGEGDPPPGWEPGW